MAHHSRPELPVRSPRWPGCDGRRYQAHHPFLVASSNSSASNSPPPDSAYEAFSPSTQAIDTMARVAGMRMADIKQTRSAMRRQAHIVSEQKRRTDINTHLDTLRDLVPDADPSDPKALTLSKAIDHVRHAQAILSLLGFEVHNLPHPADVACYGPPVALRPPPLPPAGRSPVDFLKMAPIPIERPEQEAPTKRKLSVLDLCA